MGVKFALIFFLTFTPNLIYIIVSDKEAPMLTPRNFWSVAERTARSRLTYLTTQKSFVQGSLIQMARACGKKNCICVTQGKKHVSWYVALTLQGKRQMRCIPPDKLEEIREAVNNYKKIRLLIAASSEQVFLRIWAKKKGK